MADNPIAFLREVAADALALAGFDRVPFAPDPLPPVGKYWLRIEGATPSPDYERDAAGDVRVWRRTFVALACVDAEAGNSEALDAAADDGLTQMRYAVEAYAWGRVPSETFPAFGTSVQPLRAAVEEDILSALYDDAKGLVGVVGYIEYTEG